MLSGRALPESDERIGAGMTRVALADGDGFVALFGLGDALRPGAAALVARLKSAGITPHIAFSSPSLEVVRGLVGQGLGYSILITRPHGDRTYSGEALAAVAIADDVEKGIVALASLRDMRKTRLHAAFEEHCIESFARR